MAKIAKFHLAGCRGGDCDCLWELDYRPLGMYGPRRRVRFKTKKQAELFLAQTTEKAARREYVEPARIPKFGEIAEDWFQSKTDRRPSTSPIFERDSTSTFCRDSHWTGWIGSR